MPCRYDEFESSGPNLRDELDKLTRMLCKATSLLRQHGIFDSESNRLAVAKKRDKEFHELRTWDAEHQEADRKRAEEEAAKKQKDDDRRAALKKLSAKDRKALGID